MLLSAAARANALAPMLVTPAGMVMLAIPEPENALSPMLVILDGSTTAPIHDDPSVTTRLVIVKFGVELDVSPVAHRYVPSAAIISTVSPFQDCPTLGKPVAPDGMKAFAPAATPENTAEPTVGALPRK